MNKFLMSFLTVLITNLAAGIAMAAKAHAFMQKRGFVIPEDVKAVAKDILRHRIGLSFEAEAEEITADYIVDKILSKVQAP